MANEAGQHTGYQLMCTPPERVCQLNQSSTDQDMKHRQLVRWAIAGIASAEPAQAA
jgi:hypothetical protein